MDLIGIIRSLVTMAAGVVAVVATVPADRTASSQPAAVTSHPLAARVAERLAERRTEIPPQERAEFQEFVRQNMPELHKQIELVRKTNPQRAETMLRRVYPLYHRIKAYPPEVRDAALTRHKLNVDMLRTAKEMQAAKPQDKARFAEQLKTLAAEQFDKEMVVREYEFQQVSKQLARLKDELEKRRSNRDQIIQALIQRTQQIASSRPAAETPEH